MAIKTRNVKWEFTAQITSGAPLVSCSDGTFVPMKVVLTNYGDKCSIVVSGIKKHPYSKLPRSTRFNICGYDNAPEPPQWVLDLLGELAFPKDILQ